MTGPKCYGFNKAIPNIIINCIWNVKMKKQTKKSPHTCVRTHTNTAHTHTHRQELFVSIGHLSLTVKDWLMITIHRKISEGKENVLWAIWFSLCGNFWVISLYNQYFVIETTWPKICHTMPRPIETKFNEGKNCCHKSKSNTFQLILWGQYYSDAQTRKKYSKNNF